MFNDNFFKESIIDFISTDSGADILENKSLFEYWNSNIDDYSKFLFDSFQIGSPIIKLGSGKKSLMIVSGVHGNELPPQIAIVKLLNELKESELDTALYFVPSLTPKATNLNRRKHDFKDLNRITHKDGSLSNILFNFIIEENISAVGDFHSTSPSSNPGRESVFCSRNPTDLSVKIAKHIANEMDSEAIIYKNAGSLFRGAIEDECNLVGIPAVTCETLSENGIIRKGSVERSYEQMKHFLRFFNVID